MSFHCTYHAAGQLCSKVVALPICLLLAGCTTGHYLQSADKDAYAVIRAKTGQVKDMAPGFSIETTNTISFDGLELATNVVEFFGPDGGNERGARVLGLDDALQIAVRHSRTYQSRKEQLYLSALSLTLTRHQFTPIFSGSGSGTYTVTTDQSITTEIDQLTGQPVPVIQLSQTERVNGSGSINSGWLVRDVGRISTALTADFLRFITGDPRVTTSSQLSATFLRPLLRDAGFKQQAESLLQAERQMLYDLRDFTQFRKDFSVQIATAYYRVLGSRDAVRNSYINLQTSKRSAARTSALADEGRATRADLGRLQQQELSVEGSWINAIRSYKQSLDNFKIQLGLSVDTNIILDDRELAALQIHHPDISVEDAVKVAFAARLDYQNSKDQLEDAARRVVLAEEFLKPRLDLTASATLPSTPGNGGGFNWPDPERYRWNAGLSLDPGLDKTSDRNSYRSTLITRNRAARSVEQQEDQIKLAVRESWRTLDQAKRNYEISEISVKLAERRVDEQSLRAELGSARAQDQVDAQNDLINSKNQRTLALVNHTIARLEFWNNMGILHIQENGQWEELQDADAK